MRGNEVVRQYYNRRLLVDDTTGDVIVVATHLAVLCTECEEHYGFTTSASIEGSDEESKALARFFLLKRWRRGYYCDHNRKV